MFHVHRRIPEDQLDYLEKMVADLVMKAKHHLLTYEEVCKSGAFPPHPLVPLPTTQPPSYHTQPYPYLASQSPPFQVTHQHGQVTNSQGTCSYDPGAPGPSNRFPRLLHP